MQININCKSIPTSFDVVCSNCEWTGVATLDYPENVKTLSVGGEINWGSKRESQKIPSFRMMKIQSTPRLT